jgi:hypothetical protein
MTIQLLWPYLGPAKREQFLNALTKVKEGMSDKTMRDGGVGRPIDALTTNQGPKILDMSIVSPPPAPPAVGASGDGADARTPEAPKTTGYCNYPPHPDNTGPRTNGGTSLGGAHGV